MIVLDAMLPDESGLEIFERIHRGDPQVPMLMISASADSDTVIEAMKLGALDYLVKPLDFPTRPCVGRSCVRNSPA